MTVDLNLGFTQLILKEAEAANLSLPQQAYVLATAYWETNRTMLPVEEAYYLGPARAEAYRRKLRYYPWHGRGFVQLTWERNYIHAAQRTGADLIGRPELAMDPDIAAKVLVLGSREGWFTGRRLAEFTLFGRFDYLEARRIINGRDCAAQIAAIANEYEDALTPAPAYPFLRRGSRPGRCGDLARPSGRQWLRGRG